MRNEKAAIEAVAPVRKRASSPKHRTNSSTDRVLGLIDLFTVEAPIWTVDEIANRLAVARVTVYRYVKALIGAGFLAPVGGEAGYTLGPRFVEIDRQIRISDPLIRIAKPIFDSLMDKGVDTQILCRFYGTRVMTIYEQQTDPQVHSTFDRGNPFPLFRGAPSKCILAHLSQAQQQRLFLHHAHEIGIEGLGNNWPDFRARLKAIKLVGYAIANDIDPKLVGVAAPIFSAPGVVTASICLVRVHSLIDNTGLERLGALAVDAARSISSELAPAGLHLP